MANRENAPSNPWRLRLLGGLGALLLGACSGSGELATTAGPETCASAGEQRPCGLELRAHDGVVECATGTQICDGAGWGLCLLDATKKATRVQAPAGYAPPLPGARNAWSVGGAATSCTNNPCNPYCQVFSDVPDAAVRGDVTTITLEASPGPSLENSNVPNGIGNKGDDPNGVCQPGCSSQACLQACQFDMKCSPTKAGTCVPWAVEESGSCIGIDITAPTTCSVTGGRNLTVCNRGTLSAAAGVKCYLFPGNSQHMPDSSPDVGGATLIMTTNTVIEPGHCETQTISTSLFDSNGTEELVCNPSGTVPENVSVSASPTTQQSIAAYAGWTSPERGYDADDSYATATPLSAQGTLSAGPFLPTTAAAVGTAEPWSTTANAYGDDGQNMTATPSSTATSYVTARTPTIDDGSLGTDAYANDGAVATLSIAKGKSASVEFTGFGFANTNVPVGATIASVTARVVWKVDAAKDPVTVAVQMSHGGTAIGTAATATYDANDAPTTLSALNQTVTSGVTPSLLTDSANFGVTVSFDNLSSGKGLTILASIDYVEVGVTWTNGTAAAIASLGGFHFDNLVPADATITSLTSEVKWSVAAAAANATLELEAYKNGGQVAIAGTSITVADPPTSPTVSSITTTSAGLTGSDLADANFALRVTASRSSGAAFTAAVDWVKVTALYSTPQVTNAVLYGGFGLSLPANATVTKLTTEVKWHVSSAVSGASLGAQVYVGGGATALGSELVALPPPASPTVATLVLTNPAVTPAELADGSFKVRVRATR